jgi:hypothetical protein
MKFYLWSPFHITAIIAPFIVAAFILTMTKTTSNKANRIIGIILSSLGISILLIRNIALEVANDFAFLPDAIPLQLCHFANFFFLFAFVFNNKILYAYGFTINMPAAILALVFAGGVEQYPTIISWHGLAYFVGHLLLIVIPLFALFKGLFEINKRIALITSTLTAGLFLISNPISNIMNLAPLSDYDQANYFFSVKPNPGFPMTTLFNMGRETIINGWYHINIVYLILTTLLGVVIIFALYGIYQLLIRLFKLPQYKKPSLSTNFNLLHI